MEPRELLEFLTETGKNPFSEWIHSLVDVTVRARIRVRLNRLRMGNLGDCKPVGDGVFELRMDFGPGFRIYFGQEGRIIIVLLCGGVKKRQSHDIETARSYWQSYKRRKS